MSEIKISEPFVWPFALTEEEIATWIALSNRMRGHISVQLDKVDALEDKLEASREALAAILDSVDARKVRLDVYELELAQRALSSI